MKAYVDPDTCIGCGICASICPEVYVMNDDSKSEAMEGDLPPELEAGAQEGANACPVDAIHTE